MMTVRTLGRGFWLGITASLILHTALISNSGFHLPRWDDNTLIDARLEPAEFKAVAASPSRPNPVKASRAQHPSNPPPAPTKIATAPAPATMPTPVISPAPLEAPPLATAQPATSEIAPPATTNNAPTELAARNLKTLPSRIEIVFELNGMLSGRQTHRWHHDGQRYQLETEAEVTGLAGLFLRGKLTQTSNGKIGPSGLMPEHYAMQRLSGKRETLDFDYENNLIAATRIDSKRGTRSLELPLLTGAQDPLSAIYQLAMAAQNDGDGLIIAAGAKRIKGYPYRVGGLEKLETPLGVLDALRVTRAGDATGGMQLWLSQKHHALPIKIIYTDDDGTEWVLEASQIKVD